MTTLKPENNRKLQLSFISQFFVSYKICFTLNKKDSQNSLSLCVCVRLFVYITYTPKIHYEERKGY